MATLDEIFAAMPEETAVEVIDGVFMIDPNTRKISVPDSEAVFGVESDEGAERKYFRCPRIVGNNIDLTGCAVRVNYRNANSEVDAYIVTDLAEIGDDVVFSWELSRKVTRYKGNIQFIVCAINGTLEWNTTLATGVVLEGLEPDTTTVEESTSDVVAQLVSMVEAQIVAVQEEGATQVVAVETAAEAATAASVAEIEAKGVNTRESIPTDYTALSDAVGGLVRNTAGAIVCEAEGSAVAVNDASDNYVQGLRIFGRSTQDGTPTPDAPVEIVSVEAPVVEVCGKNLLRWPVHETNITRNGITFTANEDGSVTVSGTTNASGAGWVANYQEYLPKGTYTLSGIFEGIADTSQIYAYVVDRAETKTLAIFRPGGTGTSFVVEKDLYAAGISMAIPQAETINGKVWLQLERGATATKYEHPKNTQRIYTTHALPGIPVASGGNYTDSDGQQWICDEVDFERGVYVQRTESVVCDKLAIHDNDTLSTTIALTGTANAPLIGETAGAGLCNVTNKYAYNRKDEAHIYTQNTAAWAFVPVGYDYTNNPPIVLAALSKPIETPLSETELAAYRALHTNKPNTTILNDSGAHMAVEYVADTKLYIDNKIAALTAQA